MTALNIQVTMLSVEKSVQFYCICFVIIPEIELLISSKSSGSKKFHL